MTQNSDRVEISSPLQQRATQSFLLAAAISACIFIAWNFPPRPGDTRPAQVGVEIDLNLASDKELSLIPGIGPKLANRIIQNRDRVGKFPTVESLQRVHGIGPRTAQRVAAICVVEEETLKVAASP